MEYDEDYPDFDDEQPDFVAHRKPSPTVDQAEAFGARFNAALRNARLTPAELWRRLCNDYGLQISRATVYDAHNGRVKRPKYLLEIAEICRVNYQWLARGTGTMVDISGRRSNREQADHQIRSLLRDYIIPERRNDLVRIADRFLTRLLYHNIDHERAQLMERFLSLIGEDSTVDEMELKHCLDAFYYQGGIATDTPQLPSNEASLTTTPNEVSPGDRAGESTHHDQDSANASGSSP